MRKMWAVAAVAVLVAAAGPARADDREVAVALVEKAIKAHGGEDALGRTRTLSRSGTGTMTLFGNNSSFTEETLFALPDRIRITVDPKNGTRVTLVLNGDKAWKVIGGAPLEMDKPGVEEIREEAYVLWLATLTPLLKDTYTLSTLPDGSAEGEPVAGVKVVAKGHFDAKLYFSKRSHLLLKIERHAREAGQQLEKTYIFGDYKDVDGVQLPTRELQLLNGKKFIERTQATYKILRRADDAAFAKP
jgi:hypothetical protein